MSKKEKTFTNRKTLLAFMGILLIPALYFLFTYVFPYSNGLGMREESPEYHVVKEGGTLEDIALRYDLSLDSIRWTNEEINFEELKSGDRVEIPPMDGVLVTVDEGDTIESLAEEYTGDAQEIADFNWLDYPYDLEVGSEIFIPYGVMPE